MRPYRLGPFAGPFVAVFVLGSFANVFANTVRRPCALMSVPGSGVLVPGSFGVRSMAALLSEQTAVGVDTAFHMFVTAMAPWAGYCSRMPCFACGIAGSAAA